MVTFEVASPSSSRDFPLNLTTEAAAADIENRIMQNVYASVSYKRNTVGGTKAIDAMTNCLSCIRNANTSLMFIRNYCAQSEGIKQVLSCLSSTTARMN